MTEYWVFQDKLFKRACIHRSNCSVRKSAISPGRLEGTWHGADAAHDAANQAVIAGRQRPPGFHCLLWRVGNGSYLRGAGRSRPHALVLVAVRGVVGKPSKVHMNDHAPTIEEAEAQFEAAWRQWLAWAKLREDT